MQFSVPRRTPAMQPGSIIYIIYSSTGSKLLHFIKYQTSGEICVRAGLDTMDRKCSWNIICVGGDTTWDPPQHHSSDNNSSVRTRPRTSALAVTGLRITSAAPCLDTCHLSEQRWRAWTLTRYSDWIFLSDKYWKSLTFSSAVRFGNLWSFHCRCTHI